MNAKLQEMLKKFDSMTDAEKLHLIDTMDEEFAQDKDSGFQWHTDFLKIKMAKAGDPDQLEKLNLMKWEL